MVFKRKVLLVVKSLKQSRRRIAFIIIADFVYFVKQDVYKRQLFAIPFFL